MLESLESRRLLSAAMVKDINTAPSPASGLWTWVGAGSHAFLSQDDGVAGWELWKTDGTTGGTVLVKDVRPGRDNSQPGWLTHMGDGTIFFVANNGTNGVELWKSDGTPGGTYLVKDINPGAAGSTPGSLVNVNGTLFFSANDGVNGAELWKSDGTEGGTVMVKNIAGGATGSSPTQLINNNGTLFFRASNVSSGFELWTSNGSEAGTTQVKEIANSNNNGVNNVPMALMGGFVYFSGSTPTSGSELWRSDGTSLGTTQVKEIASTSSSSSPTNLKTSGSLVYFTVSGGPTPGLYRTDGTDPGTTRLAASPTASVDVNGTFFFNDGTTLSRTDGTTVTPVKSGITVSFSLAPSWTSVGGMLYFPTNGGNGAGVELWKSDGTGGGTAMVSDFDPGAADSNPVAIIPLGPGETKTIIGTFNGSAFGGAIYRTDGTVPGTALVKDINPGTDSSIGAAQFTPFNGNMYFLGFEPAYGLTGGELYRSDGTEAGTSILVDLNPGPTGASVSSFKVFGNHLYFAANDGSGIGKEMWRTDGTPGNATLVKNINPGSANSNWGGGTVSGNYLFFWATTDTHGEELWRTDGTDAGTVRLTDINPNTGSSQISLLTDVNGTLFFTAVGSGSAFAGLWSTDGETVTQVASGSFFSSIASMITIDNTLYISGTTAAAGAELYKIGPGDPFPVIVEDISPGSSSPGNFVNVDGKLFFTATTSANGLELWKSDGTAGGTDIVEDIRLGPTGSSIGSMVGANGVAYFRADDGVAGAELWRSDGTEAGTYLLKDIVPPGQTPGTTVPTRLYAANGFVYFAGDDIVNGQEAWRTDGTTAGTAMIGDYLPEGTFLNYPAVPAFFTALDGEVYYLFTDDTYGSEPWKAEQPDFATLAGGGALTISGTGGNDVMEIAADPSGGITVTLNGLTESFAPGQVSAVQVVGHVGVDTIKVTAGTVTFGGDLGASTSNPTVRVALGATASFNSSQHLAGLHVETGGNAALTPGGGKVLVFASTPIIEPGAALDLADNDLVVNYSDVSPVGIWTGSAYDGLAGMTKAGRIVSSMGSGSLKTLAVAEASEALSLEPGETGLFAGQTVDATAALIKFTWGGDANLDGKINIDDYGQIDFNIAQPSPTRAWFHGDFNFDGKINIDDYGIIDFNVSAQDQIL